MHNNPYQAPAYQQAGYGGQPIASGPTYEFNEVENLTIQKLARRSKIWGVFALITGVFGLLGLGVLGMMLDEIRRELPGELAQLGDMLPMVLIGFAPVVFVNLIIGGLYIQSGGALQRVVDTEGNDIELMMQGVKKMGNAFMIEAIVSVISMVIGFVAGIVIAGNMGM